MGQPHEVGSWVDKGEQYYLAAWSLNHRVISILVMSSYNYLGDGSSELISTEVGYLHICGPGFSDPTLSPSPNIPGEWPSVHFTLKHVDVAMDDIFHPTSEI